MYGRVLLRHGRRSMSSLQNGIEETAAKSSLFGMNSDKKPVQPKPIDLSADTRTSAGAGTIADKLLKRNSARMSKYNQKLINSLSMSSYEVTRRWTSLLKKMVALETENSFLRKQAYEIENSDEDLQNNLIAKQTLFSVQSHIEQSDADISHCGDVMEDFMKKVAVNAVPHDTLSIWEQYVKMFKPSASLMNALILQMCIFRNSDTAWSVYEEFRSEGYVLETNTAVALLGMVCEQFDFQKVSVIFQDVCKTMQPEDLATLNFSGVLGIAIEKEKRDFCFDVLDIMMALNIEAPLSVFYHIACDEMTPTSRIKLALDLQQYGLEKGYLKSVEAPLMFLYPLRLRGQSVLQKRIIEEFADTYPKLTETASNGLLESKLLSYFTLGMHDRLLSEYDAMFSASMEPTQFWTVNRVFMKTAIAAENDELVLKYFRKTFVRANAIFTDYKWRYLLRTILEKGSLQMQEELVQILQDCSSKVLAEHFKKLIYFASPTHEDSVLKMCDLFFKTGKLKYPDIDSLSECFNERSAIPPLIRCKVLSTMLSLMKPSPLHGKRATSFYNQLKLSFVNEHQNLVILNPLSEQLTEFQEKSFGQSTYKEKKEKYQDDVARQTRIKQKKVGGPKNVSTTFAKPNSKTLLYNFRQQLSNRSEFSVSSAKSQFFQILKEDINLSTKDVQSFLDLVFAHGGIPACEQCFQEIAMQGVSLPFVCVQEFISVFAKEGMMNECEGLLELGDTSVVSLSTNCFDSLIQGYGIAKDVTKLKELYEYQLQNAHRIEASTFLRFIQAFTLNGDQESAKEFAQELLNRQMDNEKSSLKLSPSQFKEGVGIIKSIGDDSISERLIENFSSLNSSFIEENSEDAAPKKKSISFKSKDLKKPKETNHKVMEHDLPVILKTTPTVDAPLEVPADDSFWASLSSFAETITPTRPM